MQVSFLSYYATQCFQHIYLATSTLWGANGIIGAEFLDFSGRTRTLASLRRVYNIVYLHSTNIYVHA